MASDQFFTPLDHEPEPEPQWDPLSQPDWQRVPYEVAPSPAGEGAVVARSERFAITLAPLVVYDRGLLLELTLIRNPWGDADTQRLMTAQHGPHGRSDGGFRAGLRWADGRVARSDDRRALWSDTPPLASMITRGGGGSSDASGSAWWVWPLPEAGDLELVVEFADGGIAETTTTLSGDAIRAAASRATPIWSAPGA